jgi:hypothetical protein
MTTQDKAAAPKVVNQIAPDDPTVWRPNSLVEWTDYQRLRTALRVWVEQAKSDRAQRESFGKWIIGLLYLEVIAALCIVIAIGLNALVLPIDLFRLVFPALFAQLFGVIYVIARYLYSSTARQSLDHIILRQPPAPPGAAGQRPSDSFGDPSPAPKAESFTEASPTG